MCQGSRMVSRRVGDNTVCTLFFSQVHDSIGGSPEFESPHLLKIFALEEKAGTADGIELP
jgi:hypothetical protein